VQLGGELGGRVAPAHTLLVLYHGEVAGVRLRGVGSDAVVVTAE
jgi:hypothetical protein